MSYQVLARKYRPQLFSEVVGQIHVTQTLQNALELGRIHHAYLFCGARGVGKTTVARILAKALNCQKGGRGEPCSQCEQCVEIVEGKSMDVLEIDGASNTSVDDVRQIREQVKYLPARGKYKIYIIDEVHMLSTSAFNALLKTLEEPPAHVIFIFATTESHKIPATILSRCQRYDFRRIPAKETAAALEKIAAQEKVEITQEALRLLAEEAQGSLRDGQSLLDQAIAFAGHRVEEETLKKMLGFLDCTQLQELLEAILRKDRHAALQALAGFYEKGADFNRLAQEILTHIRHLYLTASLGEVPGWLEISREDRDWTQKHSKDLGLPEWDQLFGLVYRGVEEIARSLVPKMNFEVLLIRMTQITEVIPVAAILERLEQMGGTAQVVTAPVAAAPPPKTDSTKNWETFASWLQKEKPQLASIINHSVSASLHASELLLKYEENSVYGEMLQEEDRKKQFVEQIAKFFGKPLGVRIEKTPVQQNSGEDPGLQRKKAREAALTHESVKEAANILGGVVEEVRTALDE